MKKTILILACYLVGFSSVSAQINPAQPLSAAPPMDLFYSWAKPIKPFQIAENVWYVGTNNLSSILITTTQGHILIDAALDENAENIKENIASLGFKITDIRYLLNSHARLDQAGGLAKLKQWSGASLISSQENALQLARGGNEDFALGNALPFPAVNVDTIIQDNDSFKLGNVKVTALLTPGHLPGATSWKVELINGKTLIYADSLATPDYFLLDNKNYPNLVKDIRHSFDVLAAQHADIFIANKGDRFDLLNKIEKYNKGNKNAFFDSEGLQNYVKISKSRFEKQLAEQTK